jgi:Xaa-Pro aminopeptidase
MPPRLTADGCSQRQAALISCAEQYGVSVSVLADPRHVLYFSGIEVVAPRAAVLLIDSSSGATTFIGATTEPPACVDRVVEVPAQVLATQHLDHPRRVAEAAAHLLRNPDGLLGADFGGCSLYLAPAVTDAVDLTAHLLELRRNKYPDELAVIAGAVRITESCYRRAREIVYPGVGELEVYAELYRTAVLAAGERLPLLGNDFQCGTMGGPPRAGHRAEAGELYILDLGAVVGGYHADLCRTFAVGGDPTPAQLAAWQKVSEVLQWAEERIRPGMSCRRLYHDASRELDPEARNLFPHHLGHGIGLSPHERPALNPHWDQTFEEGDVFTLEPGIYSPELRGGIRLEQNYRLTATGLERLSAFPLEL